MPTHPPLSVHRPPLPPHWYETMSTFTQCTGGAEAYSVCMCEVKPLFSSFSEVKSSWPLIQLWLQVCAGPKLPTCVCHFCQQPLRHGGWNLPPHPLFLRVSLGLYTHSPLSGPQEACLLAGIQGEKLTRTTS